MTTRRATPMLLYATTVDPSQSNGPGVNEREFTHALRNRFGDGVGFVLPTPAHPGVVDGLQGRVLFRPMRSRMLYLLSQLAFLRTLARVARTVKPSLIIARTGQLPLGLALFARFRRIPLALKTQGDPTMKYLCDQPGRKGWVSRRLRTINLWAARTLARRAVAIDCCTPELIERNVEHLDGVERSKFMLVGNSTNVDRFRPEPVAACRAALGLPADAQIVGYVGGAPWERGGTQIIGAVARLRHTYPALMAVIVGGKGPGLDTLRQLAIDLGVQDRCLVRGHVPYETVPQWINSFDVGVAMDVADHSDNVGSSNQKIRQYLACGKPVIASGGVNGFLEEHALGGLVMEEDAEGFARLLDGYLARSEAERAAHAVRARRFAEEQFSVVAALEARIARWREVGIALPS